MLEKRKGCDLQMGGTDNLRGVPPLTPPLYPPMIITGPVNGMVEVEWRIELDPK